MAVSKTLKKLCLGLLVLCLLAVLRMAINGKFRLKVRGRLVVEKTTGLKNISSAEHRYLVPNVVHFVWYGPGKDMKFHHMLSVLAADKFIKPVKIVVHCDGEPAGPWWALVKKNVTSLQVVHISSDVQIFGKTPVFPEHKSDVTRMRILLREGGIYLDLDVIAVQSFDPLRNYECTMGIEIHGNPGRLNNGIIVAAKDARFLKVWQETYHDYSPNEWDEHSCQTPYILQKNHSSLIHVEEKTLNYPNGRDKHLIYSQIYNWRQNFAVHMWYRIYTWDHPAIMTWDPISIKKLNSTFGQLARRTFYGTTDIID